MPTLEERVAHIEGWLNRRTAFEPIPDPRYVQVVLDEAVERASQHAKLYTYVDPDLNLKVGDRVLVPVGSQYIPQSKTAVVVRAGITKAPYTGGPIKVVVGVL